MARNVLLLAHEYHWSEAHILALPVERLNTYIETHNELVEEREAKH
jgi:hypothetical protein